MKFIIYIFLFTNLSCKHIQIKNGNVSKQNTDFGIDLPSDPWKKIDHSDADLLFYNQEAKASIFINAQCKNLSDSPLSALSAQLLVGFSEINIISQKNFTLNDREALVSEVSAKLDGVKRYLKIMVYKKDPCVYDIVLDADSFNENINKDYEKIINSFWARVNS